jgi:hypothetical protein
MAPKTAYTVNEFLTSFGIGRTKFYELVNAGDIKCRRNGGRTIILATDAIAWVEGLPALEPKKAA